MMKSKVSSRASNGGDLQYTSNQFRRWAEVGKTALEAWKERLQAFATKLVMA